MDTGVNQEDPSVSPNHVVPFVSSERFKYSLDNPTTLKSLSNIRTILDQHTNFLIGLAATTSLKNDITPLLTIPTLIVLQRLFIPLKIHQALPEPIIAGRYAAAKTEVKKDPVPKLDLEAKETVNDDSKQEEIIKGHNVSSDPVAPSIKIPESTKPNEVRVEESVKPIDNTPSSLGASLTKPSRKAVAFYAEVDQEVEEIRKRLLAASPQPPYITSTSITSFTSSSLVNGAPTTTEPSTIGISSMSNNVSKDIKSPTKTSSIIKSTHPSSTLREEVRIQHGTDVLTFETDFEGNVPVAKIDAVLSHVVALKYRLPQNREDSLSPSHRPHSREGISFKHFIPKYSNIPSHESMK